MPPERHGALVTVAMMLSLALFPLAQASQNDPEVTDGAGDAASGKDSRDIVEAWVANEVNDTFEVGMHITRLEVITPYPDISKLPRVEYSVYFTFRSVNYAAVTTVPIHGPTGLITVSFELRRVEGNESHSSHTNETGIGTASGTYTASSGVIIMNITKSAVGSSIAPGERLTRLYAMVWSTERNSNNWTKEDEAPDAGYGRDYRFTGGMPETYDVSLTCSNPEQTSPPNSNVVFNLVVRNNGTGTANVTLTNISSLPPGWSAKLNRDSIDSLPPNVSRPVFLTVSVPARVDNGTRAVVTVIATMHLPNGGTIASRVEVTTIAIVTGPPPNTSNGTANILESIRAFIMKYPIPMAVIFVLLIIGIAVAAVMRRRSHSPAR